MPDPGRSSLLGRTSIVSAATLSSRLLGFVRDAATAAVLGAGPAADALTAGLALPLLARRLLAEGAFNLAFIPRLAQQSLSRAPALSAATILTLTVCLLAAAGAGILFMPRIIGLMAPGFAAEGERAELAVLCGRIALAYMPLAGMAAIYGALANASQRVLLPALAPIAANSTVLAAIAILLLRGLDDATSALTIAAATMLAGVSQLVVMRTAARGLPTLPALRREGRRLGLRDLPWRSALGVLRAALPAFLFAGLGLVRFVIVSALVSSQPGAVAALNYAQRLLDLPLGLVGASAGAVLVPALVGAAGAGAGAKAERGGTAAGAVMAALAFALPAGVGLALLAEPAVAVLFQRGSFNAQDTVVTATFLTVLALALPVQGLERVLSAALMAVGGVRTAERIALASLAVCLAAGWLLGTLAGPFASAGAIFVSSLLSVTTLAVMLVRAGMLRADRAIGRAALVLACASLAMGLAVWALAQAWPAPPAGGLAAALRLGGLIGAGIVVYGTLIFAARRLLRPAAAG